MRNLNRVPIAFPLTKDASRIGVMHLTDTLSVGGAERVAVNIVNELPRETYRAYFCTTRADGPLSGLLNADVVRLALSRHRRFDLGALIQLVRFIREHDIEILHAHQTSVFTASLAASFAPHPKVVWHDHYGRFGSDSRSKWLYRRAMKRVSGVMAVNQALAEWSRSDLRVPADRVWYVPNFVRESKQHKTSLELPGQTGARIVCVANFRPQKDHLTLVRAMSRVVREFPSAHLLLVGVEVDGGYVEQIRREIAAHDLTHNVTLLGERQDVTAILQACDVGVLSSISEGLPLALIEYGMAELATVATSVGQCEEVLDDGRAGMLVQPSHPEQLADALLTLLSSTPAGRSFLGKKFQKRVREVYSAASAINGICRIYDTVLDAREPRQRS